MGILINMKEGADKETNKNKEVNHKNKAKYNRKKIDDSDNNEET